MTARKFAIGEVCLLVFRSGRPTRECEVTHYLPGGWYGISVPGLPPNPGRKGWRCLEHQLSKLPPPDAPSTWTNSIWKPTHANA